ncbi:MAG: hypothetical protein VX951_11170, partial [Planctomycetota bacterium]|nr:hypothetical protein [Planctomycetota bacterium]
MRQTTLRKLQNLSRLLPLLISAGAVATYLVWNYAPNWVRWVDRGVLKTYVGSSLDRFLSARDKLGTDYETATQELHALVQDLAEYRKGDRQAKVATQALVRLAKAHASNGHYGAAASVLEDFLTIDEKDLSVRANMYRYMAKTPARRAEAITGLRDWHHKFPMHHTFTEPFAELLAEEGQVGEGWQVHLRSFQRSQNNVWTLKWTQGALDNRHMTAWLVPRATGGGSVLTFQLPLHATSFSLRLPVHSYRHFEQLSLTCEWDGGSLGIPLSDEMLDGIAQENGGFRVYSRRPSINFNKLHIARTNLKIASHQRMTIHLVSKGTPVPSPAMAVYARKHGQELLALAEEHNDQLTAALVPQAAQDALLYATTTLYWRANGQSFKLADSQAKRLKTTESGKQTNFSTAFP